MFRFEWKRTALEESRSAVIWYDGKLAYSWMPGSDEKESGFYLTNDSDLSFTIDEALVPSSGAAFLVPSLLMKDMPRYTFRDMVDSMTGFRPLREEQFEGEACYVIKGEIDDAPWVLWVGKDNYLLRKTATLYTGGSFDERVEKGTRHTLMAEEIHRDIKINGKIPQKVFRFKPKLQADDLDATN